MESQKWPNILIPHEPITDKIAAPVKIGNLMTRYFLRNAAFLLVLALYVVLSVSRADGFAVRDLSLLLGSLAFVAVVAGIITITHPWHWTDAPRPRRRRRFLWRPRWLLESGSADVTLCPKCGSALQLRMARRGLYQGEQFLGCSRYPVCDGLRRIPNATMVGSP